MSKILKKETFFFGGHKFEFRELMDDGKRYLNLDVKKGNELLDWVEIPLKDRQRRLKWKN